MTLDKNAIYLSSSYLSTKAKFQIGDKLLLKKNQENIFTKELGSSIKDTEFIFQISSLKELPDKTILYELRFVKPYPGTISWTISESQLTAYFYLLGNRQDATRFLELEL